MMAKEGAGMLYGFVGRDGEVESRRLGGFVGPSLLASSGVLLAG